ncbi:hypothetical protein FA15DRAFT_670481 [Coprinopsis marcescibilis]|uniref:Uncharacterized protein n=1 Tax=Coprinopsis marcescibilis TaxID=230819 RepID=A0A5C3KS60_COPMA|nr:hypothetical protein FA15DRAFT_670481 [Coprinopsis marcescibilis]
MSEPPSEEHIGRFGMTVAKSVYGNAVGTVFAAGIVCFMALYILILFLETPEEKRRDRLPYVSASLLIFVVYAFGAAIGISMPFDHLLAASSGVDFIVLWPADWRDYAQMVATTLLFIFGDGVLLYRCYMLVESRWLIALPTITYLGTIALSVTQIVLLRSDSKDILVYELVFVSLSVLTNISITALIALRLIKARNAFAKALPSRIDALSVYTTAAHILIESAAPLSVFGICYVCVTFAEIPRRPLIRNGEGGMRFVPAEMTLALLYYAFVAISPQMIIFRVTTGRSVTQTPDSTHSSTPASKPVGPLIFVQSPPTDFGTPIVTQEEGSRVGHPAVSSNAAPAEQV